MTRASPTRPSRRFVPGLVAPFLALSLAGCSVSIGIGIGVGDDAMIDAGSAPSAVAGSFDALIALAGPGIGLSDNPLWVPADERPRRALVPGTFDWIELAAPLRAGAVPVSGGRFSSDRTLACASGSMRVRAVFLNSSAFTAGDTIELDAAACRFGGVIFRGSLSMSVIAAVGYPGVSGSWNARVSVDYAGWRTETVASPVQARVVTGLSVLEAQRFDALNAAIDFDSPALAIDPVVAGAARARQTIELLSLRLTDGAVSDSLSAAFDLADGRFAGTDIARLRARSHGVVALPGSPPAYPQGTLLVSAPDDSAVYADAADALRIRLDLDRYLDGVIDATMLTSWSDLRGLL